MLTRLFAAHRDQIVDAWIHGLEIRGLDPSDQRMPHSVPTSGCDDPAARTIRHAATAMYDAISGCEAAEPNASPNTSSDAPVSPAVPNFAAWQAAQARGPEQAAGCVYLFKPLLREYILPQALKADCLPDYLEAESRLDSLALIVFAEYTRCRERLHTARLEALRRSQSTISRWAEQHGLDTTGGGL